MSETLVQSLLDSACYPHPVGEIRLLETHISWVLLTGEFVYKLKKPVNFGFLDFSTLARRKFYCEEELRLNARFSPSLYLAVVALRRNQQTLRFDSQGGNRSGPDGEVLEYAVKMRQFDQHGLLKHIAEEGKLAVEDMPRLARKLAEFHRHGAARLEADDSQSGTPESIADSALENFRQVAPLLANEERARQLEQLLHWTRAQLAVLTGTFRERRKEGFVRECHGDLHLRNIALVDGEMTFFDCIEFSAPLRRIDIQSELAFLLMDMEKLQLVAHANRLQNSYLWYSGDFRGLAVLRFYKVYRALVRAKVVALGMADAVQAGKDENALWQEYDEYVALGHSFTGLQRPFLALMHGVSGSGKSTVAAALAGELGAVQLRSDIERKRLFGLSPEEHSEPGNKQAMYSESASARTFAVLETLARDLLDLGYPVIVDATFIASKSRRPFFDLAAACQVPIMIVDCQATPATLRERLIQRQAKGSDASEAGVDVMESQLQNIEPFTRDEVPHVVTVDTERTVHAGPLRAWLAAADVE